ncbi:TPA: hypothetical protein DIC20_05685 [Candidatus Dependentiae bacterium]|nr:MAG: hypothetical protein US03_C0010G0060 [candidate division TM6 bacterium GW2011_GWF2_36_131]KKQ02755.1 MAG: hypothetical protein US13_C0010G0015 [candidate division TM6 bacterium GW2011_GWE2_36_25]KKQ19148.1 MAG: hypothetical protein US32_C0015G0031 [candidate division TM6 bacterium GW2011_GWA2_36_9]HBR70407.1 hypothetical protein [Candidatus Dependentiae bacterium]HCU01156.1 hypothetical protein [Candidatus Dependentiae bacterium]
MKKLTFLLLFLVQITKPHVFIANIIASDDIRKILKLPLYPHGINKTPRCSFDLPSGEHEGYFYDSFNEDGTFSAYGFLSPYKDEVLGCAYRLKVGNELLFFYLDEDDLLRCTIEYTRGGFPHCSMKEEFIAPLIEYIDHWRPSYSIKDLGVFSSDKNYWIDIEIKKVDGAIDVEWRLHEAVSKAK